MVDRVNLPGNRFHGWTSTLSKHQRQLRIGPPRLSVIDHTYKSTARKLSVDVSLGKKDVE